MFNGWDIKIIYMCKNLFSGKIFAELTLINTFAAQKKIKSLTMLIINVKEEESIDRALKRYKRKVRATKVIQELRNRKNYTKPSVERRNEVLSAEYRSKKFGIV